MIKFYYIYKIPIRISVLFVFTAKFTIYRYTTYYYTIFTYKVTFTIIAITYNTEHFVVAKNGVEFWN